jgi:hypothetical protein
MMRGGTADAPSSAHWVAGDVVAPPPHRCSVPAHQSGGGEKKGAELDVGGAGSRCSGAGPVPAWWDTSPAMPALVLHGAGTFACRPRQRGEGGLWPRGRNTQSHGGQSSPCVAILAQVVRVTRGERELPHYT